jgi:PTS system galactitol-specific IIB component
MVPSAIKDKVINGVALLTGVGVQKVFDEIEAQL